METSWDNRKSVEPFWRSRWIRWTRSVGELRLFFFDGTQKNKGRKIKSPSQNSVHVFQDFPISDLDGDIFDGKKRKNTDFEDVDDKIEEISVKKSKKKKTKAAEEHFPGKFVLLNQPQETEAEVNTEEDVAITSVSSYRQFFKKLLWLLEF